MINIGGNPLMILLAIVAALGGVGLYFVRNFKPELARDHDVFFSAIALVYGVILLGFNFRMEITTQLAQVLVVGFAGWFAVESLILRQALAEQARRSPSSPFEQDQDDEPVRPNKNNNPSYGYRVELDPRREISDRPESSRRMRSASSQSDPSELGGDVRGREGRNSRRRNPKPNNSDSSDSFNDQIIDVGTEEVNDSNPRSNRSDRRRGRNNSDTSSSDLDNPSEFLDSDRPGENRSENPSEIPSEDDNPGRRRRPRNSRNNPPSNPETPDDFGDF
jgi:Ycf66 protein N-terminus